VLYLFEYDESAKKRIVTLLQVASMPIAMGDIACLRMELYYGAIRCMVKAQNAATWTTALPTPPARPLGRGGSARMGAA